MFPKIKKAVTKVFKGDKWQQCQWHAHLPAKNLQSMFNTRDIL